MAGDASDQTGNIRMKRITLLLIVAELVLGCVSSGRASRQRAPDQGYYPQSVDIFVTDDRGSRLPFYPVKTSSYLNKAYLEAREGQHYSIEVINRSGERIGVVIAVDGRNIISGKYSKLRSKERMYILEPHQREVFNGWRSARNRINRFYFTDAGNAYSASFNDYSAMGVIAVAAFRDYYTPEYKSKQRSKRHTYKYGPQPGRESAGTGWGQSEYSPSHQVEFHAENKPFYRHFLKYEWRESLCEKRILDCYKSPPYRHNRMWDEDDGYAPTPGRRYRKYNEWSQ